jgi:hypothetical protein
MFIAGMFVIYKIFSTGLALAIMHVTITRILSSVLQTVYDKIYYEKLYSGKKIPALREKKFQNEKKTIPPFLQVKWSVP